MPDDRLSSWDVCLTKCKIEIWTLNPIYQVETKLIKNQCCNPPILGYLFENVCSKMRIQWSEDQNHGLKHTLSSHTKGLIHEWIILVLTVISSWGPKETYHLFMASDFSDGSWVSPCISIFLSGSTAATLNFHCSDLSRYYNSSRTLCIKCWDSAFRTESFSISYWDLIKFPYFTDTTKRGVKGWKEAQRQGNCTDISITLIHFLSNEIYRPGHILVIYWHRAFMQGLCILFGSIKDLDTRSSLDL